MREKLAPVILFVYNRPEHTKKTIEALSNNSLAAQTELFIFSDAAKTEKQKNKVLEVRKLIHKVSGFKNVHILEAENNRGLANSVISGVTDIINKYDRAIVLEDDILTSKIFLEFMNGALDFYENEGQIWSISGYKFPFKMPDNYKKSVFLTYRASSWGWATWKDRWSTVDWSVADYKKYKYNPIKIAHLCKGGTDMDKMLRYQMKGKIDSWAIRWCYSQSMQNRYTVCPSSSLASNIGTDGSGTHCDPSSARFQAEIVDNYTMDFEHGLIVDKEIARRFRSVVNRSVLRKIKACFSFAKLSHHKLKISEKM